jgi:hypothetical protein
LSLNEYVQAECVRPPPMSQLWKIANPVLDGPSFLGRIVRDDIAKPWRTLVALPLQYPRLQCGTVAQTSETARAGNSELALR